MISRFGANPRSLAHGSVKKSRFAKTAKNAFENGFARGPRIDRSGSPNGLRTPLRAPRSRVLDFFTDPDARGSERSRDREGVVSSKRVASRGQRPRLPALAILAMGLWAATGLHQAVQSGDLERVKEQLARGADVNARDELGATPLHD